MTTTPKKTAVAAAKPVAKASVKQKVSLKLSACDHVLLDNAAVRTIIETAKRTGAIVKGPIPLPTEIKKIDLLRSPHVNSKSREQLEIRTHKRHMTIEEPSNNTIAALQKLDLPAGVYVEIIAS